MDIKHQYDEEQKGKKSPFWIEGLKPIQIATFDLDEYSGAKLHEVVIVFAEWELSPYTILMTGPTTVANLFYNMASANGIAPSRIGR